MTARNTEVVEIDHVRCYKETDKAILVEIDDSGEEKWIPKSVISDDSEVYERGTEGTLVVHEWFAEREGLL